MGVWGKPYPEKEISGCGIVCLTSRLPRLKPDRVDRDPGERKFFKALRIVIR